MLFCKHIAHNLGKINEKGTFSPTKEEKTPSLH